MVTINSAENALKTVYLGVVANQLNINANPLLGKIKQTTSDVWGKEIKKLAPYGINGGIGAGTEDGSLPMAAGNNYLTFTTTLKNLYGKIDISDKAIRASSNNTGAFVNLLNDEMEGLIKASSFNLGRMLYGNGTGLLTTIESLVSSSDFGAVNVYSAKNLIEGMVVDMMDTAGNLIDTARITYINRLSNRVRFNKQLNNPQVGYEFYVQGSKGKEITGIGSIFDETQTLYGLNRETYPWLTAYKSENAGEISDTLIQTAIDFLEEVSGSEINYISCSQGVRSAYQEYLGAYRRNIDIMELNGGYKAITYNGIPVVADRFVEDGTMYLLNTNDFVLHQLCDWKWLEDEEGRVLKQNAGYPTYSATLVKYADLICDKPNGQAKITGISSTVTNPFKVTVNVDSSEGNGQLSGNGTSDTGDPGLE